jgi:quercetin dioxygenase-like cupin family protein
MLRNPISALAAVSALLPALASGQPTGVHKTALETSPFPGPVLHTVLVRTDVYRGGVVAPHTHPGLEVAFVVAGRAMLRVRGQPDRQVAGGGSFAIPPGAVHSVRNTGPGPLTIVSTYVVDRSKPISSPAR